MTDDWNTRLDVPDKNRVTRENSGQDFVSVANHLQQGNVET